MKHIKVYESDEIKELKKYAIWQSPLEKIKYEIIEIVNINKLTPSIIQYSSRTIYKIIDNKEVHTFSVVETFNSTAIKDHILYTSDDLQDCRFEIELLIAKNKYNL